jgi:hypothetical protein
MENRQYYTVKIPNPNSQIQYALEVSIGENETQRYSLDGSLVIIKTTPQRVGKKEEQGIPFDTIFPPGLTTELTYNEALELMQTSEWQNEEL